MQLCTCNTNDLDSAYIMLYYKYDDESDDESGHFIKEVKIIPGH